MRFSSGSGERWQRQVRAVAPITTQLDMASYLRGKRSEAARELLRARQHLTNITQAYLDACRAAGVRP